MQKIIQIYPCLLKLLHKQDTILNIGDFSTKNYDFLFDYGNVPTEWQLEIFVLLNHNEFAT